MPLGHLGSFRKETPDTVRNNNRIFLIVSHPYANSRMQIQFSILINIIIPSDFIVIETPFNQTEKKSLFGTFMGWDQTDLMGISRSLFL